MADTTTTRALVAAFLEAIWNRSDFGQLPRFLHPDYRDHSLPASLPPDAQGLQRWIAGTSAAFEHRTHLEDQVTEGPKCAVRIRMHLKHIGEWRGLPPTRKTFSTVGYRLFQLQDGKIIAHWALVDGQTLENEIRSAAQGCSPAR